MSHPFRKMTTRQLRKLLQDDRERNRLLAESSEPSASDPPVVQPIRIHPHQSQRSKISSDPR